MRVTSGMVGQSLSEAQWLEGSEPRGKDHDERESGCARRFCLFAGASAFETRAILDLQSSDNWTQVYGYAP